MELFGFRLKLVRAALTPLALLVLRSSVPVISALLLLDSLSAKFANVTPLTMPNMIRANTVNNKILFDTLFSPAPFRPAG
jgi:hypothetical protein